MAKRDKVRIFIDEVYATPLERFMKAIKQTLRFLMKRGLQT